jgi:hypothetical protein
VVAVEVRHGWCSSHGGWKMRAGIGAGDGGGAHSSFYRAEEGVKGRGGSYLGESGRIDNGL